MKIYTNESMKKHTSFKVGGNADCIVCPEDKNELIELVKFLREKNYKTYILGRGTNILVSDEGVHGCIIEISKEYFSKMNVEGNNIKVGAGALLTSFCDEAANCGLSGLEALCGIPGSVGGAIAMNASAYDINISDHLEFVEVISFDGEEKVLSKEDCKFAYRDSIIQKDKSIVINATFSLINDQTEEILKRMSSFRELRKGKQPLDKPSAGSFFKRPSGHYAGQLIEESDLKGEKIGGASVSTKHCGFIVNDGEATSKDIYSLMKKIQNKVSIYHGIDLEPEVKMWGKF
ncbi:MAG: UDP-N-acetylmuramate dehydrogenase [Eubacteriales bacterium]|nr:UDP-N-acetylmuramate dehydrogenase [Eubacteriales bacterium]